MKKDTTKDAMKQQSKTMKTWHVWLSLSIAASSAFAQNDTTLSITKEGVREVITTKVMIWEDTLWRGQKIFHTRIDTLSDKTLTIEQFIQSQPKDAEQRNKSLRNLNEIMKKEPE